MKMVHSTHIYLTVSFFYGSDLINFFRLPNEHMCQNLLTILVEETNVKYLLSCFN